MEIISKKDAIKRGLRFYFTGKSCKRGHLVERKVANGDCHTCYCQRMSDYYRSPKGQASAARQAKRNEENPNFRSHKRAYLRKYLYAEPTRLEPNFCELCGDSPSGRTGCLCFDHDHESGTFRGWICTRCNQALGLFRDNPELLLKAVSYLKHK